jgi:hypothetical protein
MGMVQQMGLHYFLPSVIYVSVSFVLCYRITHIYARAHGLGKDWG